MCNRHLLLRTIIFLLPVFAMAQQEDDLINWSATRRLSWQDYHAQPDSRSDAAATTGTQVGFEYHIRQNQLTYTITCKFSKSKSWVRYQNEYILSHEQGHFDIAEIFTRELVKAMREYTFNKDSYKNDLKRIYSEAMRNKENFQRDYDRETNYSRIKDKQAEWLKKIASLLGEYKDYADYQ